MKTAMLTCVLLGALGVSAFAQDSDNQPGKFMFSAGVSVGSLVAGNQYHDFHDTLSPTPDKVGLTTLQADLRFFPMKYLGFEVSSDVIGLVYASAQTQTDLYEATLSVYSGGALFRLPLPINDTFSADLFVGGGATYNTFRYASDYINLVNGSGYSLQGVDPQIGYYLKTGASIYLGRPFFGVVEVEYLKVADTTAETRVQFDGDYLRFNLRVGMDF